MKIISRSSAHSVFSAPKAFFRSASPIRRASALLFLAALTAEALTSATLGRSRVFEAGFCLHLLGSSAGARPQEAAGLAREATASQRVLLQVLTSDAAQARPLQEALLAQGIYGLVSVEGSRAPADLPYSDDIANGIAIDDWKEWKAKGLSLPELVRVLAPGGKALIEVPGARSEGAAALAALRAELQGDLGGQPVQGIEFSQQAAGMTVSFTKAAPAGTDEWTHRFYGPEGNPVSKDTKVAPPTHLKWTSGGDHVRSMSGSFPGIRIAGGRAAYIHMGYEDDKISPLVVRDAYNGSLLWKSDTLVKIMWDAWTPFLMQDDRIFVLRTRNGPVSMVDAASGRILRDFPAPQRRKADTKRNSVFLVDGKLIVGVDNAVKAYNPESGALLWTYQVDTSLSLYWGSGSKASGKVFFLETQHPIDWELTTRWPTVMQGGDIVALNLADGKVAWRSSRFHNLSVGQLLPKDDKLMVFGHGWPQKKQIPVAAALNVSTGAPIWVQTFEDNTTKVSQKEYYNMLVMGDKVMLSESKKLMIMDIQNGNHKIWKYQGLASGINQRCSRSSATEKYMWFGYGTWIDKDMNYEFKPLRRNACAMPAVFGYGMTFHTPATCGCIPELDGGKGYLALSSEGSRKVVPDDWRLVASQASNWILTNGTVSIKWRPKTAMGGFADALKPEGPIVGDWPEYRAEDIRLPEDPALAKSAAASASAAAWQAQMTRAYKAGGYDFVPRGSRLQVDVLKGGELLATLLVGARVDAAPVVVDGKAYLGARDGYVYAFSLPEGRPLWRFLAAPYDRRVLSSSQLESSWPVGEVKVGAGGSVEVTAGRHQSLAGGLFHYGLDGKTGKLLWKKRSFTPGDGSLSNPEAGYALTEEIEKGQTPQWDRHAAAPAGRQVKPVFRLEPGRIRIDFGPGGPVEAKLEVAAANGRIWVRDRGVFTSGLAVPLSKLPRTTLILTLEVGGQVHRKTFALQAGR